MGFPGGRVVKNLPANVGDMDSIPGLRRSLAVVNDKRLQYSSLENSLDRGTWRATVPGVPNNQTWLSMCVCMHTHTHTHTNLCVLERDNDYGKNKGGIRDFGSCGGRIPILNPMFKECFNGKVTFEQEFVRAVAIWRGVLGERRVVRETPEMGVWLQESVQEGRKLESGSHLGSNVIGLCW